MRKLVLALTASWLVVASPSAATWTEVRTEHYQFLGDASRGDIRRIALRFEQFHAVMQQVLSRASLSFSAPTIVLVFRDSTSMRPYQPLFEGKPIERSGLALSASDINYIAINADGGEGAYPIVFHELAHLITHNVSQISSTWLLEAIAEYYSSFEMRGDDEVILGSPIGRHAILLRDQFIPLRQLLAVDHSSKDYNEDSRATVFYAESWALLHYLRFSETTRQRFAEYIKLVEDGTPDEQAIKRAFGLDLPTLEKGLLGYVRRFSMMAERRKLTTPITDAGLSAAAISETAVLPHLATLQAGVGRVDEAERVLVAAAAQNPSSAAVHAALARLRLRQDRGPDAQAILRRNVDADGFLDHYLIAAVLARHLLPLRGTGDEAAVKKLKAHASAAVKARGDVPEAWRLLASAHLLDEKVDDAGAAIERALALAPANEYYRFVQAEVFVRRRDFGRARSIRGELMAHGRTPDIRSQARRTMGSVAEYELASKAAEASGVPAREREEIAEATPPSAAPSAQPMRLIPVFRETKVGETRVFGELTAIECRGGRVSLVTRVDGRELRVSTSAFERIDFISYRSDLKGEVGCAARTPPDPVYLTWKGEGSGTGDIAAESIAVEFTPREYRPE